MKTLSVVLVSVAMLATASFGAANTPNDPSAEQRFKMKTGRYTQAEEARRQSSAKMAVGKDCTGHSCCRHGEGAAHQPSAQAVPFAEQWLQAKSGRNPSAPAASQVEVKSAATVAESATDTWQRTKLGRSTSNSATAPALDASAVNSCGHPGCCE